MISLKVIKVLNLKKKKKKKKRKKKKIVFCKFMAKAGVRGLSNLSSVLEVITSDFLFEIQNATRGSRGGEYHVYSAIHMESDSN